MVNHRLFVTTLLATALASVGAAPMASHAADPSLKPIEVDTPCGRTVQIPGEGIPGKEGCSGNFATSFSVGDLTITYNSQFEGYSPTQPSLQPSVGFGRGMRALSELIPDGQNLKLVLSDGSIQRYEKKPSGRWESEQRLRGDLSFIRTVATGYELVLPPGSTVTTFGFTSNGRFYPTEVRDENGPMLQLLDYSSGPVAMPLTFKDTRRGTSTKLSLSSDRQVVTQVTDSRGRAYTLSYAGTGAGRLLTDILLPNGKKYSLGYDRDGLGYLTSVVNPFNQSQFLSYYKHGRLAGVGGASGSSLISYTTTSITAQELNSSGSPLQFQTMLFTDGFVTGARAGNGGPTSTSPGMVLSTVVRDPIGRVTSSKDQFGTETKLHYNQDGTCSTSLTAPGISALPTCIESEGVKTQTTYDANYLPIRTTRIDPTGKSTTAEVTWESARPNREVVKDAQGRTTSETSLAYERGFPARVTTKTTTYFDEWDTSVLGRLKRLTDSNGIETAYQYDANGDVSTTTSGGIATTISSSIQPNGSSTMSVARNGVQASMTSNFLGTETSRALSKVGAASGAFSASGTASVRPGAGTLTSSQSSIITAPGGRLGQQSSSTESVDWQGKTTTSGTSGISNR